RGFLDVGQTDERDHDAGYGAEQADIRADRADVGEEFQILFEPIQFTRERHAHAALRAFENRALIHLPAALPQAREFAEARLEDAFDAVDALAIRGDFAEQRLQIGA